MLRSLILLIFLLQIIVAICPAAQAQQRWGPLDAGEDFLIQDREEDPRESDESFGREGQIPDPFEPLNRCFFQFNDKFYFWVLKPVSKGYNTVAPELLRVSIRNFFSNLCMPIRAVSCLLQGKITGFGEELLRFVVNSSAGFLGFQDVAKQALNIEMRDEDLAQTLGFYGIGPGFYIHLPILGPFSGRSLFGWAGEQFLNPVDYFFDSWTLLLSIRSYDYVNRASLRIGEYEALKRAALDPYVSLRNGYWQYRENKIKE